jgi:hypothetical protein
MGLTVEKLEMKGIKVRAGDMTTGSEWVIKKRPL